MKKTKLKKGFSLMELIITVTIIIILSAISGPIYKSFSSKAQLAEAYALLGTIRSAQDAYFNDRNNYFLGGETCKDDVLGIDVRPNKYYTSFKPGYDINGTNGNCTFRFAAIAYGTPKIITMCFDRTTGVTIK